jgi:restriction endonuclease S subunit
VRPLKRIAALNPEVLPEDTDPEWTFPYVDIGNVTFEAGITGNALVRFADAPSRARRRVRNGDTIVSTVRTYLRAIAPVWNQPDDLIVSTGFAVIRARPPMDAGYLSWALRSNTFVESVVAESVGVSYPAIAPSVLGSLSVPMPPPAEQRAIADFLDRETAKIDALIATQERLIALLDEKRQATITHAVTKGLDPDAPMKESGDRFVGEIPEHWGLIALRHLLSHPLAYGANEAGDQSDRDDPRFVRITDISSDGSLRYETFRSLPMEIAKPFLLRDGDLLLARSGATVGKSFIYDQSWGQCCFAGYLIRARCNSALLASRLLHFFLASSAYWNWVNSNLIQATIQNISADRYAGLKVPVPPRGEQGAIIRHLDHVLPKIDHLRNRSETVIEHLRERRTALITAAVIGQIDVTNPAITEAAE